jgi:pyruvate ferredoxin oxidoreductase alpha subunit
VAVVDQNLSTGKGGILYHELASVLYNDRDRPRVLTSYVGGLGGRDISLEDFRGMAEETLQAAQTGHTPPPRLLYTAAELAQMRGLQEIAKANTRGGSL